MLSDKKPMDELNISTRSMPGPPNVGMLTHGYIYLCRFRGQLGDLACWPAVALRAILRLTRDAMAISTAISHHNNPGAGRR
jgi:hypothetical protein